MNYTIDMNNTEQEVIKQIKLGDKDAFRYIFDAHYTLLCRMAYEFFKDDYLAETIVSDVIFNLWEKRETIDIQTSLRAYLVQSVRNRCINYLQQKYVLRETNMLLTDELLEIQSDPPTSDYYPLATLLEKELEEKINRSINSLPVECREVFKMSRFENLKYQDIALKLNISVNTVKYHIKNALSKLSADLDKYLTILTAYLFFYK